MTYGDGSITELKKGGASFSPKKWRVRVYAGEDPATGRKKWASKTVRGTKADARKARDQLKHELESGISPDASKVTLGEYLESWISNRDAAGELACATVQNYRNYIRKWICPYLGAAAPKDVTPYAVESWHRAAQNAGCSPRSLQAAHKLLKQAMRDAVRHGLLSSNPCEAVKTPRAEDVKRGYLVPEEALRMVAVLDSMEENAFTMAVRLALATGARRGEVLGLCWEHIDFDSSSLRIVQSLGQNDGARKAGIPGKSIKGTKTKSGNRRVSLDCDTLARLASRKSAQRRILAGYGVRQTAETPVCCSTYGAMHGGVPKFAGGFLDPQAFSHDFADFCERHGFMSTTGKRLCFHELRHTQATMLIASGEDVVNVSSRLGHASPSITGDMYAHAMPEKDRECADIIGRIMSGNPGAKRGFTLVKTA